MHLPAAIAFLNSLATDTTPEGIDRYNDVCATLGRALLEGDPDANGTLQRSNVLTAAWPLGSAAIVRVLESRDYQRWASEQEAEDEPERVEPSHPAMVCSYDEH